MSDDRTRLETLATAGLPHTLLERVGAGGSDDAGLGDLAYAARSLPRTEWNAFLYLFRHDRSPGVLADLRAWLLVVASDLYVRKAWPRVERADPRTRYLLRLCDLVLVSAACPNLYRSVPRRAAAMGVLEGVWLTRFERPYDQLLAAFRGLESRAALHIAGEHQE